MPGAWQEAPLCAFALALAPMMLDEPFNWQRRQRVESGAKIESLLFFSRRASFLSFKLNDAELVVHCNDEDEVEEDDFARRQPQQQQLADGLANKQIICLKWIKQKASDMHNDCISGFEGKRLVSIPSCQFVAGKRRPRMRQRQKI